MTPDLSYYWEGAREWCEDNKWDEEKIIIIITNKNNSLMYVYCHGS